MKVSIITICYNAENVIENTIKSVINQTYSDKEYIIIDGNSKDGTVNIIKKYRFLINYWISEPDKGIYDAMNKGLRLSNGDWVIFMNAGDCFHNDNVIEDFMKLANLKNDIVYGSINKVLPDIHYRYDPYPIEMMDKCMILPHQATFIKTSFHKIHPYDTSFRSSGDYHFFYNAYYQYGAKFQQIDLIVADFDETCGMSKDNFKTARLEDLRIWGKEHKIYPVIRMRLRIVYWYLLKSLHYFLSPQISLKFRNYQLRKQSYKIESNE